MEVDAAKLVWDAQQALLRIERFIQGRDFAAYQRDELLRSAVERQFEILGEALNQLSRVDADTAGKIPELPRIVAFRNILLFTATPVSTIALSGASSRINWNHCWASSRRCWPKFERRGRCIQ